jgi:hypothetical protein
VTWLGELIYGQRQLGVLVGLLVTVIITFSVAFIAYSVVKAASKWWHE